MDRRERARYEWYDRFDERRMVIIVTGTIAERDDTDTEIAIPARFDVCGTCDGKGSHVNPAIDSQGLSREDFDEDPDFAEQYFSGLYDQPCNECHGRRVVPVVDELRATEAQLALVAARLDDLAAENAEDDAARRYGY